MPMPRGHHLSPVLIEARFWQNVCVGYGGSCWAWTGYVNNTGYGHYGRGEHAGLAHRLAYEFQRGPIPEGLTLDHLCRNRLCVNPDHLEPVTAYENFRRGNAPAAKNLRKSHCLNGHPLSGNNLDLWQLRVMGRRTCRTCSRDRYNKRRA